MKKFKEILFHYKKFCKFFLIILIFLNLILLNDGLISPVRFIVCNTVFLLSTLVIIYKETTINKKIK